MTVLEVVAACEFIGCDVYDQLGNIIEITCNNSEVYDSTVEHIDAYNNKVRIFTFDKMDEACADYSQFVWVRDDNIITLVKAMLDKIRKELDRLYWNKYQKEMASPFDNSGAEPYENSYFTVRSYYWGDDEDTINLPNFESPNMFVNWYKHSNRGVEVFMRPGMESANTVMETLSNCLEALYDDFLENNTTNVLESE